MDMTLAVDEYQGLEKPEIAAEASAKWEVARQRLADAKKALILAEKAEIDAWKEEKSGMRAALAGGGSVDQMANAGTVTEAGNRAAFARRLVPEAESLVDEAFKEIRLAIDLSYRLIHKRAVELRIEAARDADAAREAMEKAEAKSLRATAKLETIYAKGAVRKFEGNHLHVPLRTEAAERALWEKGVE